MQVGNVTIFYSLDILNNNNDSQAAMTQPVEHATAIRKFPSSSLGKLPPLLGKNLGNVRVVNGPEKNTDANDIKLARANVTNDFQSYIFIIKKTIFPQICML